MLRFQAKPFIEALAALEGTRALLRRNIETKPKNEGLTADDIKNLRLILEAISDDAEILGTAFTKMAVQRLDRAVAAKRDGEALMREEVLVALDAIHERLADEMSTIPLFVLDTEMNKYLGNDPLAFGEGVADKLPLALPDIADAGDCLAFKKGTAAVFHLMRVMEAALRALGNLLGIPYAPSWESYIRQIEAKISTKHRTKGVQWKRDEAFYRDILGNLQTIKIAWRNPTMHIVRRYSVEEAEEIYIAVRAFLKRLSTKLPTAKA